MSFDVNWDIDKYKEDHESDEHWQLRRLFMEKWKNNYPEERLVCLARVFANIEFMGCRYPTEVMQEVSRLSQEVAHQYRNSKKGKLQRTFVSASDAAEDRAKGIKRQGGVVIDTPPPKSSKILFVPQGQSVEKENPDEIIISDDENDKDEFENKNGDVEKKTSEVVDANEYHKDMESVKCLDVRLFKERMFHTSFGRMVLLIRPWASKLWNIQASCQVCGVNLQNSYENGLFKLMINGHLLAQATGPTKQEAKSIVEIMAWNRLKEEMVSILVKEQWIAQGDARISVSDVTGKKDTFGTPVENSVATKMMKMMGWKGGGLGADAQGIAEPIKPNLQMVNRAGLGSMGSDIRQLRRAGQDLMQRYLASDTLDLDLVFSSEFTKDERATLHQIAQRAGLASRSYGDKDRCVTLTLVEYKDRGVTLTLVEFTKDERATLHQIAQRAGLASRSYGDKDRFLVVKKKLDPFSIVRAVIEKGGCTPKYQVFIPCALDRTNRR